MFVKSSKQVKTSFKHTKMFLKDIHKITCLYDC